MGPGTALSGKIRCLGVFCAQRVGAQDAGRNWSCGRERDARSSRLTDEGSPAAEPMNLEPRPGEIFQRNLAAARRLVNLAMAAKE